MSQSQARLRAKSGAESGPLKARSAARTASGVEDHVREGAADADETVTFLGVFVVEGEGQVLVDLAFQTQLHAGHARTAAAVVWKVQPCVFGFLEYVLVFGDLYGQVALLEGNPVLLSHQPSAFSYQLFPSGTNRSE